MLLVLEHITIFKNVVQTKIVQFNDLFITQLLSESTTFYYEKDTELSIDQNDHVINHKCTGEIVMSFIVICGTENVKNCNYKKISHYKFLTIGVNFLHSLFFVLFHFERDLTYQNSLRVWY